MTSIARPVAYKYPLSRRIAASFSRFMRDLRADKIRRLLRKSSRDSNYVKHCRRELHAWFAEDKNSPNRWMAEHIEQMLMLFAMEGHSGSSAPFAISVFKELASFRPWGPLTGAEDEWSEPINREGTRQNKRCSSVFREANGKAYNIDGRVFREPSGSCYTSKDSRVYIEFPYTPKTEYVDVPGRDSA